MEHANLASLVASLKAEAIALRAAGDKFGAVQKVREMKELQALVAEEEALRVDEEAESAARLEQTR